ncbi:protein sidekick-1-like [Corticium candelabrum]|uniref:protein sidekick-1-like n=1 Tax=Corticium candelabrum TaxID=121492 RepID=UPI002E258094|nr:protein sidekick-1-like [Corticium candelabrum]
MQSFDRNPEDKTVQLGSGVIFYCINSGSLPLASISWEKDGALISNAAITSTELSSTQTSSSLLIANAQKSDEGLYKCVATNRLLSNNRVESNAGRLSVNAPDVAPQFTILPSDLILAPGQPGYINCKVLGSPMPIITWENGAGVLVGNDSTVTVLANGSLYFAAATSSDIASNTTFRCVASNRGGSIRSHLVSIRLATWTGQFLLEPAPSISIAGKNITLQCIPPVSLPVASVQWLKDFNPVKARPDVTLLAGGNLQIGEVRVSDEGEYRCTAENTVLHLSVVSQPAKLTVNVPPKFVIAPVTVSINIKSELRLNCSASGDPMPTIEWFLNGRRLQQDHNVTITNEFLLIHNTSVEDEGIYQCSASNAAGMVTVQASVDVQIPPIISRAPVNVTISEGSSLTLFCEATGDPSPVIQWLGPLLTGYYGNQLTINKVNRTQDGIYNCIATSVAGTTTAAAIVNVQYVPEILFASANSTVIVGMEVNYTCRADADPKPTVSWHRSNRVVGNSSVGTAALYFSSVQPTDDGIYSCTAINHLGQSTTVRRLTIYVPPRILLSPQDVTTTVRRTLKLQCQSSGIPTPDVMWEKDGVRIREEQGSTRQISISSDGTLSITAVSIYDTGQYTCIITNLVGSLNSSAYVIIQGKPDPPFNVQATAINSYEINLHWSPPLFTGNTAITVYVIQYREVGQKSWNVAFQVADITSSITIGHLTPFSEYQFAVSAENSIGTSPNSNITTATTYQAAPAIPLISEALPLSSNTIRIHWLTPRPVNGILQFYELQYSEINGDVDLKPLVLRIRPDQNNRTISDLVIFTGYVFSLRASTGDRMDLLWSNWSSPVMVKTLEGVPLKPPTNLSVVNVSSTTISLRWTIPELHTVQGVLQGFMINYRISRLNNTELVATVPPGQNRSVVYMLTNLRPRSTYAVSVSIYNSLNTGPYSSQIEVETEEGVPSVAPTITSIQATGPHTVLLTWLLPPLETHNGVLKGYHICYKHLSELKFQKEIILLNETISSLERNSTISNLDVYSFYEIKINVFTNAGDSPSSYSMIVRTGEGIPSSPTSIRVIDITRTTITLTWQLPNSVNGVIQYYTVYYSNDIMDRSRQKVSNETMIILDGLSPNTKYSISVTATNGYQESLGSIPMIVMTESLPTSQPPLTSTAYSRTQSVSTVVYTTQPVHSKSSNQVHEPTEKSKTQSAVRLAITVSCVLAAFILMTLIILCGLCCCKKDRDKSCTCCFQKEEQKRYKLAHFEDEKSDAGDSGWPLSTGDNFSFKKADESVFDFQDSFLPGQDESDYKGSHEHVEMGYDVSPISRHEMDSGFSTFKPGHRPLSTGPSPYSSRENLTTAEHLGVGQDDMTDLEQREVEDSVL